MVVDLWHGKTTSDRSTRRETSTVSGRDINLCRIVATIAGDSTAGIVRGYTRTIRDRPQGRSRNGGSTASRLSQEEDAATELRQTTQPTFLGESFPHHRPGLRLDLQIYHVDVILRDLRPKFALFVCHV